MSAVKETVAAAPADLLTAGAWCAAEDESRFPVEDPGTGDVLSGGGQRHAGRRAARSRSRGGSSLAGGRRRHVPAATSCAALTS